MDVERTIEFILQMQAQAEARAAKADERAAKADERAAKADHRMDLFEKRLETTRRVVEAGIRLVIRSEKQHIESKRDFDRRLKALLDAQKKTDQKLDRFLESNGRRSNGHR